MPLLLLLLPLLLLLLLPLLLLLLLLGQCVGTRELAAMGPANIIFSFCQYIFQALQIAAIRCADWHAGSSSSSRTRQWQCL
jgi:hypothetical protein